MAIIDERILEQEKERLDMVKDLIEAAEHFAKSISVIPKNEMFFMDNAPEQLDDYIKGDKNYCEWTTRSTPGKSAHYRLFVWPVDGEYMGIALRVSKDGMVAAANRNTSKWEDSQEIVRICQHEKEEDTEWLILEQMADLLEVCPHIIKYSRLIQLECENEEILELYEKTKDYTYLFVDEDINEEDDPDENTGSLFSLEIQPYDTSGTMVKYTDGKYVFFLDCLWTEEKEIWKTAKIEVAKEALKWMFDHKSDDFCFPVSKDTYVSYDLSVFKVFSKKGEMTKTEEKMIEQIKRDVKI